MSKRKPYTVAMLTEAGMLRGWRIDNPDGSALLIKCAGGTTADEAWMHVQNLVACGNMFAAPMRATPSAPTPTAEAE